MILKKVFSIVNKRVNDKERVFAALENESILKKVLKCVNYNH